MLAAACLFGAAAGMSGCSEDEAAPELCDDGDQAWVRRALVALQGRRAYSQAEINVYAALLERLKVQGESSTSARTIAARAMMAEEDVYRERWSEFIMDSLEVLRTRFVRTDGQWDLVQAKLCYGPDLIDAQDKGALAAWVRDNSPFEDEGAPYPNFGLGRLLASAIELDDLTPIYRAQLFHMLAFPMSGANVDPSELEQARRLDFGTIFEHAYINRDPTCLPCHNSYDSVTSDRTAMVPGLFEEALFGSSEADGAPPLTYYSIFRVDGVRDLLEGNSPWGWNGDECGRFKVPFSPDPLGIEARFGSVGAKPDDPAAGLKANVWELEAALSRGFSILRSRGLELGPDNRIADPDAAFAYLVSMNIVEKVWTEVIGSPLTIAHYFPRNEAQRDILKSLTDTFVASGYSLKSLLTTVVTHPAFNLPLPDEACGSEPYELSAVFNPWSRDEQDPALRGNSSADAIHHLSSRLVVRSLHRAMEWPFRPEWAPSLEEENFESSIGMFIAHSKRGFRGLDFQARLSWEDRYGACANPGGTDFINSLVSRGLSHEGAQLADLVVALKDRLLNEPSIDEAERGPLEQLFGAPLDTPVNSRPVFELEDGMRLACGAYIGSPQFLLGGFSPPDAPEVPRLTPAEHNFRNSCERIAAQLRGGVPNYTMSCLGSADLGVAKR